MEISKWAEKMGLRDESVNANPRRGLRPKSGLTPNKATDFKPVRAFAVAGAMAAIPLLTILDQVFKWPWAIGLMAIASLSFIALQGKYASAGIRRTTVILMLITLCLSPWIDAPLKAIGNGLRIGCLIASLLITVNLLSRAALRVHRVREVVSDLYQLPDGQRYLGLTVGSQFFGGLLGLAGITMMMEMAARQGEIPHEEKISSFSAISRGYAALSLWSPMYSNMSIVLAIYNGPDWAAVLPYVLAVSALLMALGVMLEKFQHRSRKRYHGTPVHTGPNRLWAALPVIAAMLLFLTFMVLTSQLLDLPISAVIIPSAPIAAWLLNVVLARANRQRSRIAAGTQVLCQDFLSFQSMVGEVMLFIASGCAGTVMASAIPAAWTAVIGQLVSVSPILGSLFLSTSIILLSSTAIHPMLSAVLVASSFTPQLLGLPVIAHLCAVLVGWGLAIIITPFSVLSLMASRYSGIPILTISLRANLWFASLSVLSSALVLGGLTHLLQS